MSKLFNAQNAGFNRVQPEFRTNEFLIYFNNTDGDYTIYRYNHLTGDYAPTRKDSELLDAEHIYISYAYLGGIHLCNYTANKASYNGQITFTFNLNRVTVPDGPSGSFWDLPNAVFIERDMVPPYNRGTEPVYNFSIVFSGDNIVNTTFSTFGDRCKTTNGKNWSTDYGQDESSGDTKIFAICDLSNEQIVEQGLSAMSRVEIDSKNNNPMYMSYRAGLYYDGELDSGYIISAAFFGYAKINNAWYKRLYMVAYPSNALKGFNIEAEPDTQAYASIIQASSGSIEYDEVMGLTNFGYFQLAEVE